jgi:hypothetical protein
MAKGRAAIDKINIIGDIPTAGAEIKALGEALTSKAELGAYMKARFKTLGITFDRETKTYSQQKPEEDGGGLL